MKRCNRNDAHDAHAFQYGAGGEVRTYHCPGYLGDVRAVEKTAGQLRAEAAAEALLNVRTLTAEAIRLNLNRGDKEDVRIRVELAKANANAALAYAIGDAGSDLEVAISSLASVLREGVSLTHE